MSDPYGRFGGFGELVCCDRPTISKREKSGSAMVAYYKASSLERGIDTRFPRDFSISPPPWWVSDLWQQKKPAGNTVTPIPPGPFRTTPPLGGRGEGFQPPVDKKAAGWPIDHWQNLLFQERLVAVGCSGADKKAAGWLPVDGWEPWGGWTPFVPFVPFFFR